MLQLWPVVFVSFLYLKGLAVGRGALGKSPTPRRHMSVKVTDSWDARVKGLVSHIFKRFTV